MRLGRPRATRRRTRGGRFPARPSPRSGRVRPSRTRSRPRGQHYDPHVSAVALAALIVERQPCVALTGAGISTESGIPDFRSPTGLWADVDPFEVASIQAFRRDPARVWSFYRERIDVLLDAKPNAAHSALAQLERKGLVSAVVTQNIDMLHSRAGSEEVVEVHGSIRSAQCLRCLWTEPAAAVLAQLAETPVPACPQCG